MNQQGNLPVNPNLNLPNPPAPGNLVPVVHQLPPGGQNPPFHNVNINRETLAQGMQRVSDHLAIGYGGAMGVLHSSPLNPQGFRTYNASHFRHHDGTHTTVHHNIAMPPGEHLVNIGPRMREAIIRAGRDQNYQIGNAWDLLQGFN